MVVKPVLEGLDGHVLLGLAALVGRVLLLSEKALVERASNINSTTTKKNLNSEEDKEKDRIVL